MEKKRLYIALPLGLFGLYIATRRKYRIPEFSVFIPNTGLFTGRQPADRKQILKKIYNAMNIEFTTEPDLGWIFSFKPLDSLRIPVRVWLPWDFPIAYPQVKAQLGKNLKIERKTIGDKTLGYQVSAKGVEFYA